MLQANQVYTIVEPDGRVDIPPAQFLTTQQPQFMDVSVAVGLMEFHQESLFDDFAAQPTLPRQLSHWGQVWPGAMVMGMGMTIYT